MENKRLITGWRQVVTPRAKTFPRPTPVPKPARPVDAADEGGEAKSPPAGKAVQ